MAVTSEQHSVSLPVLNVRPHHAADLEKLFADCFYAEYKTLLCGGAEEPLYRPAANIVEPCADIQADGDVHGAKHVESTTTENYIKQASSCVNHTLFYREDFYASALHEISHWCIAGYNRRKKLDFGYWYIAEGRNKTAQQKFYTVEKKPQAIEYLFSIAAAYPFSVSADNPEQCCDNNDFWQQVNVQAVAYCKTGMPLRAKQFCQALLGFYQPNVEFSAWFNSLETLLLKHHKLN